MPRGLRLEELAVLTGLASIPIETFLELRPGFPVVAGVVGHPLVEETYDHEVWAILPFFEITGEVEHGSLAVAVVEVLDHGPLEVSVTLGMG